MNKRPSSGRRPLSWGQTRFVSEYLVDLSPKEAYKRAGSPEGREGFAATDAAAKMLQNPDVVMAIQEKIQRHSHDCGLTTQWVISRLMQITERCMQAEEVLTRDGEPTGMYEFDSMGALRALELLGKRLQLFTEKKPGEPETPTHSLFATMPPSVLLKLSERVRAAEEAERRGEPSPIEAQWTEVEKPHGA